MKIKYLTIILLLLFTRIGFAQFSGYNLLEYQYGKLPTDTDKSFSNIYDRALFNYSFDKFRASVTIENYYSPFESRNYTELSQFSLQYRSKSFDVKIGNFYETIGRGLLLRTFEIPGAILEDLSYRSRHYFHKDIQGASVKFRHKAFTLKLLYGKPLNYLFPPTQGKELRRPDEIAAVSAEYGFMKQNLGVSIMRLENPIEGKKYYSTIHLGGNLFNAVDYYGELAHNMDQGNSFDFSDQGSYAFYFNMSTNIGNLGINLELKDYNDFLIGSGINEPPALVKEHRYRLLNRSTHVLQPTNETGYQIELFYGFSDGSLLTFNHNRAINKFQEKFVFDEYFAEFATSIKEHELKVFVDYANDPFKLELNRYSAGIYSDWRMNNKTSLIFEYEYQTFKRSGVSIRNHMVSFGFSYKSKLSANIIMENSSDPFLLENKSTRTWLGGNVKYKFHKNHNIQIFGGQRRGGPACNSGICYDILDFEGVEIRLTSRF